MRLIGAIAQDDEYGYYISVDEYLLLQQVRAKRLFSYGRMSSQSYASKFKTELIIEINFYD
ncbi:MAG TPA: hypothetical protein VHO28_04315 [Ignavibacteriales bacterium]|nr:hypothetical protein [Ignavibacteriales bacterium]